MIHKSANARKWKTHASDWEQKAPPSHPSFNIQGGPKK